MTSLALCLVLVLAGEVPPERQAWGLTGPPQTVRPSPRCQRMLATYQARVQRFEAACIPSADPLTARCLELRDNYSAAYFALENGRCLERVD